MQIRAENTSSSTASALDSVMRRFGSDRSNGECRVKSPAGRSRRGVDYSAWLACALRLGLKAHERNNRRCRLFHITIAELLYYKAKVSPVRDYDAQRACAMI